MTNKQLIECVPNFSEGRDMAIVRQITDAISAVEGVRLLDVERRLGHTDKARALASELEGWVAVADADFVVRSALR